MKFIRFFWSPGFLMLVIIGVYVLRRVAPDERARIFAILALTAFAAIELVTVGNLLLRKLWSGGSILAHSLNVSGSLLMAYSSLDETATIPLAAGALTFATGMILWKRELQPETT